MKIVTLMTALLALSSTSRALVADRFKCNLQVKEIASGVSTQLSKDFYIARLPLSSSPAPDVRLTGSQTQEELTLSTSKADLGANLNFYYKHAVRLDSSGTAIEARQMSCIGLGANYCEKSASGSGHARMCSSGQVACAESLEPFDPNHGWSQVSLVNGVPRFNAGALGPVSANIQDNNGNNVGLINLDCQYLGTFE